MNRTFCATMLAGVSLCALLAAGPASAQQSANERVYRQEALAHARAVTTAWRRLESYILEGSAGTPDPDGASVSGWSGAVPPAGSGWSTTSGPTTSPRDTRPTGPSGNCANPRRASPTGSMR